MKIIMFLTYITTLTSFGVTNLLDEEQTILELEYQRVMCCLKKLQCCIAQSTDVSDLDMTVTNFPEYIKHVEDIESCIKTISINFKLPYKKHNPQIEIIVVRSVDDNGVTVPLKYPLLVKIKQEDPLQFFYMQKKGIVNSQPHEQVFNKDDGNYTGCTLTQNPTCGVVKKNGITVPFSTGFCCSCDPFKNVEYAGCIKEAILTEKDRDFDVLKNAKKRSCNRQTRGWQDCDDTYTPKGLDEETYHESAHCLRYSKVWYTLYKLKKPVTNIKYTIKIYKREYVGNWSKIYKNPISVSNLKPCNDDIENSIKAKLSFCMPITARHPLEEKMILVPDKKTGNLHKYPETKNGPGEYLVISPSFVDPSGESCDKVGVGYKAFFQQRHRCKKPRGTCLHNQPIEFWKYDHEMNKRNRPGKYFLKNYVNVTEGTFADCKLTGSKILHVDYVREHTAVFEISLNGIFPSSYCEKNKCS